MLKYLLVLAWLVGIVVGAEAQQSFPACPTQCPEGQQNCTLICLDVDGCMTERGINMQDCNIRPGQTTAPSFCPPGWKGGVNPVIVRNRKFDASCPVKK